MYITLQNITGLPLDSRPSLLLLVGPAWPALHIIESREKSSVDVRAIVHLRRVRHSPLCGVFSVHAGQYCVAARPLEAWNAGPTGLGPRRSHTALAGPFHQGRGSAPCCGAFASGCSGASRRWIQGAELVPLVRGHDVVSLVLDEVGDRHRLRVLVGQRPGDRLPCEDVGYHEAVLLGASGVLAEVDQIRLKAVVGPLGRARPGFGASTCLATSPLQGVPRPVHRDSSQ